MDPYRPMAIKMAREREIERGHGLFAVKFRDNFHDKSFNCGGYCRGEGLLVHGVSPFPRHLCAASRHLRSRDNRTRLIVSKLALRPAGARAHYLPRIINLY